MLKTIILGAWLALAAIHAGAAEGTNSFPVLTINGQSYTNAYISTVTPAYAVILYDGGGRKFPLGDLPPFLQQRFGYDPEKADAFEADEASKRKKTQARLAAAEAAAIAARGDVEMITIAKVMGGIPPRCLASTSTGQEEILLTGLPQAVVNAFTLYQASKEQLDAYTSQESAAQSEAKKLKSNESRARGNKALAAQANANSAAQNAAQEAQELANLKKQFEAVEKTKGRLSHVNAFFTGTAFATTPIWRFVSITNQAK